MNSNIVTSFASLESIENETFSSIIGTYKGVSHAEERQLFQSVDQEKAKQTGLLEDANGNTAPIINWKNSDVKQMTHGNTYDISDIFVIQSSQSKYATIDVDLLFICRSRTAVQVTDHEVNVSYCCPDCETETINEHKGPEYPLIGWQYFVCESCDSVFRENSVTQ